MNTTAKLALGAAAVVVAALLGLNILLPGGADIGGPEPTDAVSIAPDPTPTALRAGDHPLSPGRYVSRPLASNRSLAVIITVPDGWQAYDTRSLAPVGDDTTEGPDGAALGFSEISGIHSDPCNSLGNPDVATGTTAEDLANAFRGQTEYRASVEDITLAGYSGKRVEFQLPSSFDASCPADEYFIFGGGPYAQGVDNRWHLTILDVEQSRLVIFSQDFAGTPAEVQAGLRSMIDSIRIEIQD